MTSRNRARRSRETRPRTPRRRIVGTRGKSDKEPLALADRRRPRCRSRFAVHTACQIRPGTSRFLQNQPPLPPESRIDSSWHPSRTGQKPSMPLFCSEYPRHTSRHPRCAARVFNQIPGDRLCSMAHIGRRRLPRQTLRPRVTGPPRGQPAKAPGVPTVWLQQGGRIQIRPSRAQPCQPEYRRPCRGAPTWLPEKFRRHGHHSESTISGS